MDARDPPRELTLFPWMETNLACCLAQARGPASPNRKDTVMANVLGTSNMDWLIGTNGSDYVKGFGGNDVLKGGGGADTLDGGMGKDTASYLDSIWWVEVNLDTGRGWSGSAQGDVLINIENVVGSTYGDRLEGDIYGNTLSGMDGGDTLIGGGGADILQGGPDTDQMTGGAGADMIDGGDGSDWAYYQESPAAVFISFIDHTASGGDAEGDTLIGVENTFGSQFADHITGDNGWNYLGGYEGDDVLSGLGEFDSLAGGRGRDLLIGGSGGDMFWWYSTEETGTTEATADVVADFNLVEGDRIQLGGVDANAYTFEDEDFTFIGTAAFSGTPGEVRYYYSGGNTYIEMQTGTSADVEAVIRLNGIHLLQESSFYL
jgi:serralysin